MESNALDISINVEAVAAVGQGLQHRADSAKTYTARLFSSSETAVAGNAYWLSAASLAGCRQAWQGQVNRLIDQTRKIGQAIAAVASQRVEGDREAATRIRRVIREMSGRGTP